MSSENSSQLVLDLVLPDRYEVLQQKAPDQLSSIVVPVQGALSHLDDVHQDMLQAGRGAFMLLRGNSGAGKSTFLHTAPMFRGGVRVFSIPGDVGVSEGIGRLPKPEGPLDIVVLEEREALSDVQEKEIERDLHVINSFLRKREGARCLIVWPCNTDDLQRLVERVAMRIGLMRSLGSGNLLTPSKAHLQINIERSQRARWPCSIKAPRLPTLGLPTMTGG